MLDFTDQTIIVTGAAGNLGSAIARRLSRHGAQLILTDMSAERVAALAKDLPGPVGAVANADVRTHASCAAIVAAALDRFGRVDGLANTVGAFRLASITEGAADDWSMLLDLNALTALRLSQAVLPSMAAQGYGRIVNVAAGAGQKSFAGASVYAASKAALLRITETISEEHKGDGVTANCVMPGTMQTPQNAAAMPDADRSMWVEPDAVASLVAFLLSKDAGAITGAAIPATGRN
jgi:NAD(P)-dependent dehydrogenase (short-subunit alcohol dehydrogenase family)